MKTLAGQDNITVAVLPHNALVVARGLESAAVSRKNVVYRSYRWILA